MASANNAKKGANVRMKRKERKNIAAGQAHIQSTFNNTVVTITDLRGNAVSWQQNVLRGCRTVLNPELLLCAFQRLVKASANHDGERWHVCITSHRCTAHNIFKNLILFHHFAAFLILSYAALFIKKRRIFCGKDTKKKPYRQIMSFFISYPLASINVRNSE